MIFYTADLHFGNDHVRKVSKRPFSSVEEMDNTLIKNWNSVVSEDDTVYFVGDIGGFMDPIPEKQLAALKGHKHLIRGNHDTGLDNQESLFKYFETVSDFLEIDDGESHILMNHYPFVYRQRGYMIHGHIHITPPDLYEILRPLDRVLNAGVDVNGYKPATLPELIENNSRYFDRTASTFRQKRPGCMKWKPVFKPLPIKPGTDK